ncbi:MAG: EpsG family protein [Clostridia bacterium]|nr:EpsG family protein [Clostridia bacterium]
MGYVCILALMAVLRVFLREDTRRNRRIFCVVSGLLLIAFSALRHPTVGRDTASFIDVFLKVEGRDILDVLQFSSWTEPGFRLLCALVGLFTKNGQWLIVLTSVIIHGSVTYFLYRHAKNPYLGLFLYMALMIYPLYLCIMRQALAVAIFLFAYGFLKKKKWLPYVLIVLLAATFHTSVLIFLACPFLTLLRVTRKRLRWLLPATGVLAVICLIFVRPIITFAQRLFPKYADYEPTTFLALYGFFAFFLVVTVYGLFRLYLTSEGDTLLPVQENGFDERSFLTLMMLLGVVLAAMMTGFGQLQRLFHYFELFYLLWLPAIVPPLFCEKKGRVAVPIETMLALGVAVAYFLVLLFLRSGLWYDAMPYRFFW